MGPSDKREIKQEIARQTKEIKALKKANKIDIQELEELRIIYTAQESDIKKTKKEIDRLFASARTFNGQSADKFTLNNIDKEKVNVDHSLKMGYRKMSDLEEKIKTLKEAIKVTGRDTVSPQTLAEANVFNKAAQKNKRDKIKPETQGQQLDRLKDELKNEKSEHSTKIEIKMALKTLEGELNASKRFIIQGSHLKNDIQDRNKAITFYEKRNIELKAIIDKPTIPSNPNRNNMRMK